MQLMLNESGIRGELGSSTGCKGEYELCVGTSNRDIEGGSNDVDKT